MDRERVVANQTVVIKNGLIVEIGDAKKVKLAKDAVRIDGTGKYLLPGLVDMHTHLLSDSDEFPDSIGPDELRVMVANGVTTVRFMIGTPKNTKTDKSHPRQWVDTFRSFLQSASRQRDIA
jgi:imidazolonepropionase-like amidohydrolase